MSLLGRVSEVLRAHRIDHAVIGAAALAVHGVARATTRSPPTGGLSDALWEDVRASGAAVLVRAGDEDDPLAGVIRLSAKDQAPIDLIVGRPAWQTELLRRATPVRVVDVSIPVVEAADLVLLKLYAGGPQDSWDVDQLLDVDPSIAAQVETRLDPPPRECADLWGRIRRERGHPARG